MTTPVVPRRVELEAEHVLIEWSDGMTCRYPYRYLRLQCGCAACKEEMTGRQLLNPSSVPENVIAVDYMEVGRYALQFLWTDGHETGIYPFTMLRELANYDAVDCK